MNKSVVLISLHKYGTHGIRAIHAYLNQAGIRSILVFLASRNRKTITEREEEILVKLIHEVNAALVGISVESTHRHMAGHLTEKIHGHMDIPIVWGGVHPTLFPEESLDTADIVCIGEGEEAIVELAQAVFTGQDVTSIANLWCRNQGRILRNAPRPLITDVDSLPIVDLGDDDKYILDRNKLLFRDAVTQLSQYTIRVSRGCPHCCGFCANDKLRDGSPDKSLYVRRRKPEMIIRELKAAVSAMKSLQLIKIDELFPFSEDPWLDRFTDLYKEEIGLPFEMEWYPGGELDTQVLSRLVDAGLDRIICGIESGAEHIRREVFRRRASNSHIIQSIAAMKAAGIKVTCNFILDNPFETNDDRRETFEMVSALSETCLFNLFNLVFYPKTFVTKTAFARGLISSEEGHLQDESRPIQWLLNIDMFRFDRDPYYACLTVLSTIKFIPSRFIHRLSRVSSIRHNTAVMIWVIRILQRLHFVAQGSMVVR